MGLLTTPKDTLDYSIWNPHDLKLQKNVENQIFRDSAKIVPKNMIKEIFIIGSITGRKWSPTSDVDVNLRIPEELITPELQIIRKSINGKIIPGTKHAINYFVQPYNGPANWQDLIFGVYDVYNRVWVNPPLKRSKIRDPKQEFYFELISAKALLRKFERLVYKWKKFKNIENPTIYQKALTEMFFKDAREYAQYIDEQRKLDYKYGWGVPRKNWRNIVYKLIEHSDVGDEFEYLKELK